MDSAIVLRRDGDAFTVRAVPPVPGFDLDADYASYIAARTFARGIARYQGLPVRDEVEASEGGEGLA